MWFYLRRKIVHVPVFSNCDQSKQKFKIGFKAKNIYEILNNAPDLHPNENHFTLENDFIESMSNHLEKGVVKFSKEKHEWDQ